MTPERWQQVKELFESALERAPNERSAFLDHACDGDESLRSEVKSLLASYEEGESFMERPAVAMAAETLAGSRSESLVGKTIGHYQVTREIGSGGMGEVYLAQDVKLGRKVALKLLPTIFTADEDRLRRFEQEARTASALNHPNVCVIHEVGETEEGRHYIAMEYVDGKTLRQHMTSTRMELSDVLDVAVQIASALTAAHEVGVIHRDIKPENIMLRRDGYVKVLDFGLAKLTEQPTTDVTIAAGARAKTDTGVVMGTSSYMSPEQARGLTVDARTDIWSLGVVLYEMVASRVPFEGATTSDVIVSILEREPPPLAQLSPEAPAELQRIISKTLHKDREGRYQTEKDLLIDLKSLKQDLELEAKLEHSLQPGSSGRGRFRMSATVPAARPQPRWWGNRLIWLSVAVILVVGVAVRFFLSRPSSESLTPSSRGSSLPPMKVVPFTSLPGGEGGPVFSPDGKQIAFVWGQENEMGTHSNIYVKLIDAGAPLRLTNHSGQNVCPTWSPDGRYIAFARFNKGEYGIFIVPALGGTERELLATNWEAFFRMKPLDWSQDGKYIAFPDKSSHGEPDSIFLLSVETGSKQRLTFSPAPYVGDGMPVFSPDSQTVAFTRMGTGWMSDIFLVPAAGGEVRRLTFDNTGIEGLTWTSDGNNIVFASRRGGGSSLWKISASGGMPERLTVGGENAMHPSISRQGNRLAYARLFYDTNIWRIEVPGSTGRAASPMKLIFSTQEDSGPQYSPDGKHIAFESDRSGSPEIWLCNSDGSNPLQLTNFGGPMTGAPRWSPDSRQIVFDSRSENHSDIYAVSAEAGMPRRLTTEISDDVVPRWSRDGRWIYFASNRSGDWQVWKMPAEGSQAVQVTKQGGFAAFESPDGKFVYYAKYGAPGIWKVPVEGGEETLVLDQLREGYWGYWVVVDQGIYFVNAEAKPRPALEFFSFLRHRVRQIAAFEKELSIWEPGLDVSPDGRWILYAKPDQASDIMLVENFR